MSEAAGGAQRVVNLQELAELLGTSDNTLRAVIRQAPDFPVLERGQNGVPYKFDLEACAAWWRARQSAEQERAARRRAELAQWRLDVFGEDADEALEGLTPSERKALAEAALREDQVRRIRGDLVEAVAVEARLARASAELQRRLMTLPQRLAKRFGWSRDQRIAAEAEIRAALNEFAQAVEAGALDHVDAAA